MYVHKCINLCWIEKRFHDHERINSISSEIRIKQVTIKIFCVSLSKLKNKFRLNIYIGYISKKEKLCISRNIFS